MTIRVVVTVGPPACRRDLRPSRAPRSAGTPAPGRYRASLRPIHPARQGLGPASRAARPLGRFRPLTGQQSTVPFLRSQTDDDRPPEGGSFHQLGRSDRGRGFRRVRKPGDLGASSPGGDEGEGVESEWAGDPRLHPQPGVPETPGVGPTNGSTPASLTNPNNLGLSDLKKTGTTRKDPCG
jgi:hypothetical protein